MYLVLERAGAAAGGLAHQRDRRAGAILHRQADDRMAGRPRCCACRCSTKFTAPSSRSTRRFVRRQTFLQDRRAGGISARGNLFRRLHHQRTARARCSKRRRKKCVCVFIPTTPNPTCGFLIVVPEEKLTQARHERGRRHQIHRQPRLDFAGTAAAEN